MKKKAPIVISVLIGIIALASSGILPISIVSIIGVSILLLTVVYIPGSLSGY